MRFADRFADPERCDKCGGASEVIDTRSRSTGYRYRRHRCVRCGHKWPSWQTKINPRNLRRVS